jgi:hypothetical protein
MSYDINNTKPGTGKARMRRILTAIVLAGVLAASTTLITLNAYAQGEGKSTATNGVVTINGPRTIASNDFLVVYSSTPYHIMKGQLTMKVPCDDKSTTSLEVFVGKSPNLSAASPQPVKELSTPGKECVFHLDIISHQDSNNPIISDVVVKNTGKDEVKLSDTSSISLTVTEIMANPGIGAQGQQQPTQGNTGGNNTNSTTHPSGNMTS